MSANNTLDWSSHLGSIVSGINNSKRHILYGFSSIEAQKPKNVSILKKKFALKRYLFKEKFDQKKFDFKVGDRVKIYKKQKTFNRGYEVKTESKPDFIREILDTYPKTILLTHHQKRPFYPQEIVKYPLSTDKQKFDYFISDVKYEPLQSLRSGVSLKSEKKFKIESHSSDFNKWISEAEREKLIHDGKLHSSSQ